MQNDTKPNNTFINAHFNNNAQGKITQVEPSQSCPRRQMLSLSQELEHTGIQQKKRALKSEFCTTFCKQKAPAWHDRENTSSNSLQVKSGMAVLEEQLSAAKAARKRQEIKREMLCQHLELFLIHSL